MARHFNTPRNRYDRTDRLNEEIRKSLAVALEHSGDSDPRLEMISIREVDIDKDMKNAKVYVSSFGKAGSEDVIAALEDQRSRLQTAVASNVRMKNTPHLHFLFDTTVESGARIDAILREISAKKESSED